MQNGIAIHMLTEKKYPLSQEMISKMLKKKLEVDHESSQAFELLSKPLRLIYVDNNVVLVLSTSSPNMFCMRLHHNGVFKKWPARMYDGGKVSIFDLVDTIEVLVEEVDSLMLQMGYVSDTNWYYFLKLGCNLDNGLYNINKSVNLDCLKKLVLEHKIIDIYVEHSKTRLEVSEMSPGTVKIVFNELDDDLKKAATTSTPSSSINDVHSKFDTDNACDSEESNIEDEMDDNHDHSDLGNVLVDEDNIIDERDIDVSLFEGSKDVDLGTYDSCSMRHIYENMKLQRNGRAFKDHLWRCATSTTVKLFDRVMLDFKSFSQSAHAWLSKIPPKHWARPHFSRKANSDVLRNNMCEVFNGKIVGH
ncbi:hypothetical protein Tco_1185566 [Tanacetum coccineum]